MKLGINKNGWIFASAEIILYGRDSADKEFMCSKIEKEIRQNEMKIYRNHHMDKDGESHGYSFFPKKSDALRAFENEEWHEYYGDEKAEEFTIDLTKDGLYRALTNLASHPNNG